MAQVILIDDNEVLRLALARVLTEAGHTVELATNGFDGMALLIPGRLQHPSATKLGTGT